MNNINVGIFGGAGYTGGELIRLLINHPYVTIKFVHSKSHANSLISDVHTDLLGDTNLNFSNTIDSTVDVVFLCVAHGEAKKIIAEYQLPNNIKIIDLSQDHRTSSTQDNPFIYGLPELNKKEISNAKYLANPGCFATAIQLALIPLAKHHSIQSEVHISCTTGSTGAGQSLTESSHFSWRQNNLSVYKAFTHQHITEISKSLNQIQPQANIKLIMIPQRGSYTRGILANVVLKNSNDITALQKVYSDYYNHHPFVHLSLKPIDLKQVVNTNKCLLYLEKQGDDLLIVSIIDNLLKGASGQALQNMNLMFGLDETIGLQLKASAF